MKKLICLIAMVTIAVSVDAANVRWDNGGSDSDWHTPENWSGNALPGDGDKPIFSNNDIASISSDVNNEFTKINIKKATAVITHSAGTLGADNNYDFELKGGTYNLNGGTIAVNGNINVYRGGDQDSTLNITSGNLTPGNRDINVSKNRDNNTTKKLKISGGVITTLGTPKANLGDLELDGDADTYTGCRQILEIVGDTASISIGSDFRLGSLGAEIAPELILEFSASGITLIDVGDDFSIIQGGAPSAAKLVVDVFELGSAPQTTYDLIKYGGAQAGTFGTVGVTDSAGAMTPGIWDGLGHHEYAIKYDGGTGSDTVQLQVNTTPEPGTFMVLVLAGLAMVRVRKHG